jgi:N-acyl-D-aspartate/D-glutamate deacylase
MGKVTESAAQVIDASDLVVAPGFVDPHTPMTPRFAGTVRSPRRPGTASPPW